MLVEPDLKTGIWDCFQRVAQENGSRLAVVDEFAAVTFRELYERSMYVAARLREEGVRPGDLVAIYGERRWETIASMLAILRSRAVFAPIDPSWPDQRIQEYLAGCRATAVVVAGQSRISFDLPVVEAGALPDGGERDFPAGVAGLEDLAYAMPTSGTSLGQTKIALATHGGVIHLTQSLHEAILRKYSGSLRISLVAPFVFDPCIQQIFPALLLGHTLYVVPDPARRDGRLLAQFLQRHQIDITDGTPSHLRMLARVNPSVGQDLPVRHFLIGGEPLLASDVLGLYARFPKMRAGVTNLYGVTECACDSTYFTVEPDRLHGAGVPIGKWLGSTVIYVRTESGREAATGETGELCIAGPGVGAGYLGAPDLTAQKFVPDPADPQGRMYRTGDLARYNQDGDLEILGRKDNELKIAGKRVNPSEIVARIKMYDPGFRTVTAQYSGGNGFVVASPPICRRCILSTAYPNVTLDERGICNVCASYEAWKTPLDAYFGQPSDFDSLLSRVRSESHGPYDCLLLFSGGKDSTYVLHRLLERGLNVATFTLDNGYLSRTALEHIESTTRKWGVTHFTRRPERMDDVYRASLERFATVCDGCFRAISLEGVRVAEEQHINVLITGLSRGQIIQTKLQPLLNRGMHDAVEIERTLDRLRRIYHERDDNIAGLIGIRLGERADIHSVDYFRYDGITASQKQAAIRRADPEYSRPSDTGSCSTNCRVNDVGIYVHSNRLGYHNYGSPLSWDVRLGHITREEALNKVNAPLNLPVVKLMLSRINYQEDGATEAAVTDAVVLPEDGCLVAYVVGAEGLDLSDLREHLKSSLPAYLVPAWIHQVDEIPLTGNGKVDTRALREKIPDRPATGCGTLSSETEGRLFSLWREVIGPAVVNRDDCFDQIGGDSLEATILAGEIETAFGVTIDAAFILDSSIATLAQQIEACRTERVALPRTGIAALRAGAEKLPGLFLVHDVLGTTDPLSELVERLRYRGPIWGLNSQIDEARSLTELAEEHVRHMFSVQPGGPWLIGGWSFGGILGREIAAILQGRGERVSLLFAIDSLPPDPGYWQGIRDEAARALHMGDPPPGAEAAGRGSATPLRELLERGGRGEAQAVVTRLPHSLAVALNGLVGPNGARLYEALQRMLQGVELLADHTPGTTAGPERVRLFEAVAGPRPALRWPDLPGSEVEVIPVEATHHSILRGIGCERVAACLNDVLDSAN